jgi:hypothetical protein
VERVTSGMVGRRSPGAPKGIRRASEGYPKGIRWDRWLLTGCWRQAEQRRKRRARSASSATAEL